MPTCSACEGTGQQYDTKWKEWHTCFWCNGTGKFSLTGQPNRCYTCNGTGQVSEDCPDCKTGNVVCPMCDRRGRFARTKCEKCRTALVCWYCGSVDHKFKCPFETECDTFEYKRIMRDPDKYLGHTFCVSGIVKSIEEKSSNTYSIELQNEDASSTRTYAITSFRGEDGLRILQGDNAAFYGRFIEYSSGNVPAIAAFYAELQE